MKIPVTINGKKIILDENPDEKLLFVLRKQKLISVKIGCEAGKCGFCTVLLNDKPVSSCLIPVGIVKDCTIETLEYFSKSKEYKYEPGSDESLKSIFKYKFLNLLLKAVSKTKTF